MTHVIKAVQNKPIPIAYLGEMNAVSVAIPIPPHMRNYDGEYHILHKRHGDEAAYPVHVNVVGAFAYWEISAVDASKVGTGEAQLCMYNGDQVIAKSEVYKTVVERSLADAEEDPDAYKAWIDTVLKAGSDALKSAHDAQTAAEESATNRRITVEAADLARGAAHNADEDADRADESARQAQKSAREANDRLEELKEGIASGHFKGDPGENGWEILADITVAEDASVEIPISVSKSYTKFIVIAELSGKVTSHDNNFFIKTESGNKINNSMSQTDGSKVYCYALIDLDSAIILTPIKSTTTASTLNMYGTTFNGQKNLMEALLNNVKFVSVGISGVVKSGSKLSFYAR